MIVALANALQVAPSELTKLPVPAPANGHTDSTTEAVRLALDAIDTDRPGGVTLPVAVLRGLVALIHQQRRACQFADVATDLPGLIRNLHTTLATGADHAELLDLAVYLHVHVTRFWLIEACAPDDLLRRTVFLARRLARERGEVTTLRPGRVRRGRRVAEWRRVPAGSGRARRAYSAADHCGHCWFGGPGHRAPRSGRSGERPSRRCGRSDGGRCGAGRTVRHNRRNRFRRVCVRADRRRLVPDDARARRGRARPRRSASRGTSIPTVTPSR